MGVTNCMMSIMLAYLAAEMLTLIGGPMLLNAFLAKDYLMLILLSLFCLQPAFMAMLALLRGVWLLFGRFTLRVSLGSHCIIVTRWLRSVQLFSRRYPIYGLASISVRPARGFWGMFRSLLVRLNYKTSKCRNPLMFPRTFQMDGLKMAEQIADFIGVPLVSEFVGQSAKANASQLDKPA